MIASTCRQMPRNPKRNTMTATIPRKKQMVPLIFSCVHVEMYSGGSSEGIV
jgi:hypothetical protein